MISQTSDSDGVGGHAYVCTSFSPRDANSDEQPLADFSFNDNSYQKQHKQYNVIRIFHLPW